MGPMIILDKSALQALSHREVGFLSKHYTIVVTPVLIVEVLANLAKGDQADFSREAVRMLADKLNPIDAKINVHYRLICIDNLLGGHTPVDGRPVLGGAVPITAKDGSRGVFIDESPEAKAIMRWRRGIFSDDEMSSAQEWRESARAIDLEGQRRMVREALGGTPAIKSVEELGRLVDQMLTAPTSERQWLNIAQFMDAIRMPTDGSRWVRARWESAGRPPFRAFAPYAFYCARANLVFGLGVVSGVVTTRPTNRIDLEYLYYLPFCYVFCSGDDLHVSLSKLFLRQEEGYKRQRFVHRDELKKDLQWLVSDWDGLDEAEKEKRIDDYGSYPPDREDSVTYQLWKSHMRPRKPGSGNLLRKMSKEDQEKLMEQMRPMMDAIKEMEESRDRT